MSGQATGWVLRHGPNPKHVDRTGRPYGTRARGLRSVLTAVADAANAEGEHAHPGIEGVMRGSLYGRRQAIDLLAELVAEGWLEVVEQGGGRGLATVFRVVMEERCTPGETVQSAPGKGATTADETVHSEPETVRPGVHPNGLSTEPPNEPSQRCEPAAAVVAAGFETFWGVYPRNTAKGEARRAWPAAVKAAGSMTAILDGARRYAEDPNREERYTAHAATWLRAERWNDDPLPPKAGAPANRDRVTRDRERPTGRVAL